MPSKAKVYLKNVGCEFSAFSEYTGETVRTPMGVLIKGQAYSRAICINSYKENNANKKEYCWLRFIDMKEGVYIVDNDSSYRKDGSFCSMESIAELLQTSWQQIAFGDDKKWHIVNDRFSVGKNGFYKINEIKVPKKTVAYPWSFHSNTDKCYNTPNSYSAFIKTAKIKDKNKSRIIFERKGFPLAYFYSSEANCKSLRK